MQWVPWNLVMMESQWEMARLTYVARFANGAWGGFGGDPKGQVSYFLLRR